MKLILLSTIFFTKLVDFLKVDVIFLHNLQYNCKKYVNNMYHNLAEIYTFIRLINFLYDVLIFSITCFSMQKFISMSSKLCKLDKNYLK